MMPTSSSEYPTRLRRLGPLLAGGLALLLYTLTAAPWLTWAHDGADGGDLIAAAMTGGVPHPSGYPTYSLLARLFALLPLGSIAHRFNLFSALTTALAVALLCAVAQRLVRWDTAPSTRWAALGVPLFTALAAAVAPALWSQAVITEVYAPLALGFMLGLYLALRDERLAAAPYWTLLGLVWGLGLGVHLTLVFLLPGLLILLWPWRSASRVVTLGAGALLGLAIYAYLPLAARGNPPVNWGNPRTWEGFWWVVSGRLYHGYALSLPLGSLPSRLGAWLVLWRQQYTVVGLALGLIGLWSWFTSGRRRLAWATLITFTLYTLYAVTYDTTDSYVYLIPTFLLAALWLAQGASSITQSLAAESARQNHLAPILTLAVLSALIALPLPGRYATLDLSHDQTAAQWVDNVLRELPQDAILITGQDRHTFTLDYVRWVEGRRCDVCVIDGELLYQPWYKEQLRERWPTLNVSDAAPLQQLIADNLAQRPIYLASERDEIMLRYTTTPHGPLWRITGPR